MESPIPVPEEHSRAFTEVAHGSRLMWHVLNHIGDPAPGSNFLQVNDLYPWERVSDRTRAYLSAAFEHLILWADYVAPFKFHPEQVTRFALRPSYTLARAALESSAQAVWIVGARDPKECVRRHLSLMRWDIEEHAKAQDSAAAKAALRAKDAALVERVAEGFREEEIRPPYGGYLQVLQAACKAEDVGLSTSEAERIWRAASGSAHGEYWPTTELQHVVPGEEYEPGQFRAFSIPDPAGIAEAVGAAFRMTQVGTLRYGDYAGADIAALSVQARVWLAGQIAVRDDADPSVIERLSRPAE